MMTTGRQAMKIVERLVQIETSMVCPRLLPMFSANLTKHREIRLGEGIQAPTLAILLQIETSMICPGLLPMFSVNLTKHRYRTMEK